MNLIGGAAISFHEKAIFPSNSNELESRAKSAEGEIETHCLKCCHKFLSVHSKFLESECSDFLLITPQLIIQKHKSV